MFLCQAVWVDRLASVSKNGSHLSCDALQVDESVRVHVFKEVKPVSPTQGMKATFNNQSQIKITILEYLGSPYSRRMHLSGQVRITWDWAQACEVHSWRTTPCKRFQGIDATDYDRMQRPKWLKSASNSDSGEPGNCVWSKCKTSGSSVWTPICLQMQVGAYKRVNMSHPSDPVVSKCSVMLLCKSLLEQTSMYDKWLQPLVLPPQDRQ